MNYLNQELTLIISIIPHVPFGDFGDLAFDPTVVLNKWREMKKGRQKTPALPDFGLISGVLSRLLVVCT